MSDLYQEERCEREVRYQECRKQMVVGSLRSHLETQHTVYTLFALPTDSVPLMVPWRLVVVHNIQEVKYWCPVLDFPQGEEG